MLEEYAIRSSNIAHENKNLTWLEVDLLFTPHPPPEGGFQIELETANSYTALTESVLQVSNRGSESRETKEKMRSAEKYRR